VEFEAHGGENTEQMIRLRRPLRIVGRVIDARDRTPVGAFRVVPGRLHGDHHDWDEDHAQPGSAGSFAIELRGDGLLHAVRVEADGYYPVVSKAYSAEAEHQTELFELSPGRPLRGIVRDADGRPVAGAEVGLAVPRQPVILGFGSTGDAAFHVYFLRDRASMQRMDKSVQLRREKARARVQLRDRLAKGDCRLGQISIAAAVLPRPTPRPLILTKVKAPDPESD
jgi:hypothetical protein